MNISYQLKSVIDVVKIRKAFANTFFSDFY